MPTVLFPAAEPNVETAVEAVAEALVSPEYVYFSRVVVQLANAKIPTVLVPAAAPPFEVLLEAVAEAFVSPEYVYLLRVVL
jgi:hypothetical protein